MLKQKLVKSNDFEIKVKQLQQEHQRLQQVI